MCKNTHDDNHGICSTPEMHLHTLRSLLNYHERMMLTKGKCPAGHCDTAQKCEGKCPTVLFIDCYAEALKEAIRCIEIVHRDKQTAPREQGAEYVRSEVEGSAEIRRGGIDTCGFTFSTMRELAEKAEYFASGESCKVKVYIDFPDCERVCGDGQVVKC